jgi:predicted metal-binding membrane protein
MTAVRRTGLDPAAITSARTAATAATLASTLGLAAAAWVVGAKAMDGMDMGVATELGSFGSFVGLWVTMMAAMMLPGAAPAVWRRAHAGGRVLTVPLFVGSYLAVWTLVGVAVYALYRPHGTFAAAPKPAMDVPLALAIVGLGILIVLAPSSIPGLTPPM